MNKDPIESTLLEQIRNLNEQIRIITKPLQDSLDAAKKALSEHIALRDKTSEGINGARTHLTVEQIIRKIVSDSQPRTKLVAKDLGKVLSDKKREGVLVTPARNMLYQVGPVMRLLAEEGLVNGPSGSGKTKYWIVE
jgi:hypothetical protein